MQERTKSPIEPIAPGPSTGIFDEAGAPTGNATVISGVFSEQLPVGNTTVGEIRARFRDRFDIHPDSQAVLGGHDVGDDVIVQPGQVLIFAHRAGEKGLNRAVSMQAA